MKRNKNSPQNNDHSNTLRTIFQHPQTYHFAHHRINARLKKKIKKSVIQSRGKKIEGRFDKGGRMEQEKKIDIFGSVGTRTETTTHV